MKHAILAGLLSITTAAAAGAQPGSNRPGGQQPYRPPVSPYLNLLRSGTNPAINYYGIVRPQFEFSRQLRQVEGDLSAQERSLRGLEEEGGVAATGHAAGFMNYLHYYNFGEQRSSIGGASSARSSGRRSGSRSTAVSTAPISISRPGTTPSTSPGPTRPER